ncbi:MAG TPA: hypothetical protein VM165_14535, partial [Planctomycetaceae bacterium]|nr:hypothetical protein [Planctomycetaceae bacterium]
MKSARILVVGEPQTAPWTVALSAHGDWSLERLSDPAAVAEKTQAGWPELAVLVDGPATHALPLLEQIRNLDADLPVIVVAAAADVELATTSLRLGAGDLLVEPINTDE